MAESVHGEVLLVAVVALIAAAAMAGWTGAVAGRTGTELSDRALTQVTAVVAGSVVGPLLTPALVDGDRDARAALGRAVDPLRQDRVVQTLQVRDESGHVLWAQPEATGPLTELTARQLAALRQGRVVATGSRTGDAGVVDGTGRRVLVTIGFTPEAAIRPSWARFPVTAAVALAAFALVQLPLLGLTLLRSRRGGARPADLVVAGAAGAEAERRRIAREVHDQVFPRLTGLAYDLDAVRMRNAGIPVLDELATRTAAELRQAVADLRRQLAGLVGDGVPQPGLDAALAGLVHRLEQSGTRVTLRSADLTGLPGPAAELLHRCAGEMVRNVATHSRADAVEITVERDDEEVTMTVDDDGRGFDEAELARQVADGHMGLRALGDLLARNGGSLTAASAPGQGTRLTARVPLTAGARHRGTP